MIEASLRQLIYIENEFSNQLTYSRFCIAISVGVHVDNVITETNEQAVKIIRGEIKRYLAKEFDENGYHLNYNDWKFEICVSELADDIRFHETPYYWDQKTYKLVCTQ